MSTLFDTLKNGNWMTAFKPFNTRLFLPPAAVPLAEFLIHSPLVMRFPRIKPDSPETFFHVMTRTAQKAFYLSESNHPGFKQVVHRIIHSMAEVYYVQIFAWVYMDNHTHLALSVKKPELDAADVRARFEKLQAYNQQPQHWRHWYLRKTYQRFTDLSWFMWEINRRITVTYNKRQGTTGHFWGGRFKSKIIENERAPLRVMTYIEQNPVRAKLCERPSQYPWCSAGRAHQALEAQKAPRVPAIDIFRKRNGEKRAWAYVFWMDHQADLINHPQRRRQAPPRGIIELCLKDKEVATWQRDFQEDKPSDWHLCLPVPMFSTW